MEQGFIQTMIRELHNNRYLVEKTDYMDVISDIELSDEEDDVSISRQNRSSHLDVENPGSSLMISLRNITDNPDLYGLNKEQTYAYDDIDR